MRRYPLGDYGLAKLLTTLFLFAWIGQLWTGWREHVNEQEARGLDATWADYWWIFWQRTFENWQSEWLSVLTMATLTIWFVSKGAAESRDTDDAIQDTLSDISVQLDEIIGLLGTKIVDKSVKPH